jgi:hypothetical protein
MNLEVKVIGLVVIVVLVVVLLSLGPKWEARNRMQFRPMRKVNIPCDADLQDELFSTFRQNRIEFIQSQKPELDFTNLSLSTSEERICFVLINEEDYDQVEQILSHFQRKWFS